jgi:hypothetical protein
MYPSESFKACPKCPTLKHNIGAIDEALDKISSEIFATNTNISKCRAYLLQEETKAKHLAVKRGQLIKKRHSQLYTVSLTKYRRCIMLKPVYFTTSEKARKLLLETPDANKAFQVISISTATLDSHDLGHAKIE